MVFLSPLPTFKLNNLQVLTPLKILNSSFDLKVINHEYLK